MSLQCVNTKRVIELVLSETKCGRDRHSEVFIDDLHASRHHSIITRHSHDYSITQTGVNSITILRSTDSTTTGTTDEPAAKEAAATEQEILVAKGDTVRLQNLDVIVFTKEHRFVYFSTTLHLQQQQQPLGMQQSEAAVVVNPSTGSGDVTGSGPKRAQRRVITEEGDSEVVHGGNRTTKDQRAPYNHHTHHNQSLRAQPPSESAGGFAKSRTMDKARMEPEEAEREVEEVEKDSDSRSGGEDYGDDEDGEYSTGDEEIRSENSWILSSESDDIRIFSETEDDEGSEGGGTKTERNLREDRLAELLKGKKRKAPADNSEAEKPRKRPKKAPEAVKQAHAAPHSTPLVGGEDGREEVSVPQVVVKRLTPYELFVEAERDNARRVFADFTEKEIDMVMESRWENLAPDEKEKFLQMAPHTPPSPKKLAAQAPKTEVDLAARGESGRKASKETPSSSITVELVKAGLLNIVTVPELRKFLRQRGEVPATKKADLVQQVKDYFQLA